ncbi:MAG TPA: HAD family hydrolase, partial [Polyangia bacterium]
MVILLDIDGTLVDTNYLHVDAWARAFHSIGFGFALPGARELVEKLRADGHALWMATSAKPEELAQRLDALGVSRDILAGIVSSGDAARSKPAPDIFVEACKRAHCRSADAVVIGDTIWDMQA